MLSYLALEGIEIVHRTERGRSKEKTKEESKEKTKIGLISERNRPFFVRNE